MKSAARIVAGLAVCLALFSGISAFAQPADKGTSAGAHMGPGMRGGMAGIPIFRAAESVTGLSEEQKTKLKDIEKSAQEKVTKMRASMTSGTADRAAMREKAVAFQKELTEQINGVLTEPQKKEFEQKVKEMRSQFMGRRGGAGGRGEKGEPAKANKE